MLGIPAPQGYKLRHKQHLQQDINGILVLSCVTAAHDSSLVLPDVGQSTSWDNLLICLIPIKAFITFVKISWLPGQNSIMRTFMTQRTRLD